MIRNYITTAMRRLLRHKSISVVNILGLALGMASAIVILLFVFHELSYDQYHTKKERIFRLVQENKVHDMRLARVPYPLADVLTKNYPQIEKAARVMKLRHPVIERNNNFIQETEFYCAENSLFDIFTISVIKGNPAKLLHHPNDIVLTRSMATKYFGSTDVIGNEMVVVVAGEKFNLKISGIIKDFPENSTFRANFISSMEFGLNRMPKMVQSTSGKETTPEFFKTTWNFETATTYLLTKKNFHSEAFHAELSKIGDKYLKYPEQKRFYLQNIQDIYFHSEDIFGDSNQSGNIKTVYIFITVGALILLIACINFILLSTSLAFDRSLEIGMRKIAGASRKELFRQVLMESFLVTLIAFPISLILIEQARPALETFMKANFLNYGLNFKVLAGFVLILFLVTYLPSLFTVRHFSRISPMSVLSKETLFTSKRGVGKKILITSQFVIFLGLVSISLGIFKQIQYSKTHELGFDPEHILTIDISTNPSAKQSYNAFKDELTQHKDIVAVSAGMWVPPTDSRMSVSLPVEEGSDEKINLDALFVDRDFIKTLNINILQGRSLSDFGSHFERKILINETAHEKLGLEDPIGKKLWMGEIVGVFEDFHYHSFRKEIPPMMVVGGLNMIRKVVIKTTGKNTEATKYFIRKEWEQFTGSKSVDLGFLNQHFQNLYQKDQRMGLLISIFAGIAIIVALMGLVGLTIFTLRKRTKEIAIRKVNGAKLRDVLFLISAGYVKLVIIAFAISAPLSYFFLKHWLQDFVYQTNISWWIFAVAGVFGISVTMITISSQAYKAANKNPVDALRYE